MVKIISLSLSIVGYLLFLNGCQNQPQKLPPLPQDSAIQVYFNYNQAQGKEYLETYRNIVRHGDNLEAVIIEQINSANTSLDIAVQEINLSELARAIVAKKKQGIKVRIVMENNYNLPLNKLNNNHGLGILKSANIPIIDDREDGSKGSGLMHHKFIIIDGKKVVTGSANFTLSDIHGDFDNLETRGNANHLLVIDSPELAKLFTQEFNYLWGDGVGKKQDSLFGLKKPDRSPKTLNIGDTTLTVKFSPTSPTKSWYNTPNGLIANTLQSANNSVNLALFVFTDQGISNTLQKKSLEGVEIKALIDRNFAYQYYSEGLDLLGVELPFKCKYQPNNNPWQNPIETVGIPNLEKGDKLHHKFGLIDDYTIITGSHNWSNAANHTNDETLLIIQNPLIAQHFRREFDQLYEDAILGIPDYIHRKIETETAKCQN
ncbi:phospholipase D-like domain-containing protein [Geminocystis herdmanii]|uniref:phospholipase D-like domain-containing protein n=1 Tax=Geminocystis herdmanii TaxID=669359 RepID=UPI00034A353C|nr:phospholipase D-like domain-containing protein [Geminocystis herdmanii]